MATRIDLTFDCAGATRLAGFWKLALGYEDGPPPAPFATREQWLLHYDVPEEQWSDGAWLHDPDGVGPRLSFLGVPEAKVAKNRIHIDVRVAGTSAAEERWGRITATVETLCAAGGATLATFDGHHVVMADPEGNEFCVC